MVEGESRLERLARKSSDESYAFNREVSGSRDVTAPVGRAHDMMYRLFYATL